MYMEHVSLAMDYVYCPFLETNTKRNKMLFADWF